MRNARTAIVFSFSCLLAGPVLAQTITGGSCNASNLSGTYSLTLSGRAISLAGSFAGSLQGNGTATFDGVSNVTMTGTVNTNLASGKTFTYSGTYTVPSNCYGTITLTTGSTATFALVVWSSGSQYDITGSDATYVYSGSGSNIQPQGGCATATLSGAYTYDASGPTLQGTAENGRRRRIRRVAVRRTGQCDGQLYDHVVGNRVGCDHVHRDLFGYFRLPGHRHADRFDEQDQYAEPDIMGAYGQNANLIEANSQFIRDGTGAFGISESHAIHW